MNNDQAVHVVAIGGSLRETSYTRMALNIALQGAQELGATTHFIDLRDYDLVFCDGSKDYPEGVHQLREDVKKAQGIILGSPVYHGSYSGVLKNALDLLGFNEFEGRIMGLIGVAGGSTGAVSALSDLRAVGRVLHAWVIPDEVSIPQVSETFTDDGSCTDENIYKRLMSIGRKVTRFAYLHHAKQTNEFVNLWETAAENPGGGSSSS